MKFKDIVDDVLLHSKNIDPLPEITDAENKKIRLEFLKRTMYYSDWPEILKLDMELRGLRLFTHHEAWAMGFEAACEELGEYFEKHRLEIIKAHGAPRDFEA